MPNHAREAALDELVVQLQRIVTDGTITWAQTVAPRVEKISRNALNISEYPQILVSAGRETYVPSVAGGATRCIDATMEVVIDCWMEDDEMSVAASAMLHDVQKILGINPELTGTARDTRLTGSLTVLSEEASPLVGVQVFLEVTYGYFDTDPAVKR